MTSVIPAWRGQVLTVRGPLAPCTLGAVMMHEHLHVDFYDWEKQQRIHEEKACSEERRCYLLDNAVPLLKESRQHGLGALVDPSFPPTRAWPDVYREVSERSGVQIILCTGFYREIETSTYFVKSPADAVWPYVRQASAEELAEFCIREIRDGIHGTNVHAGAIKLGSSAPAMTAAEIKSFRAGARAQKVTGVHITTHCTKIGAETSQLQLLDSEGVDLRRVVIGHTAGHLMDKDCRQACLDWMKRGANFLPTNLGITDQDQGKRWRPLVAAMHEVFDAGQGDKLCLGLDSGYGSESGPFGPLRFLPLPPFLHMFTHTLPALRRLGLTAAEEDAMMRLNPQRILPLA